MRFREAGIHFEGRFENRLSTRDIVGGKQHPGEPEPGLDEGRIEFHGAAIVAFRIEARPDPLPDEAQVVVRGGVAVVEFEGSTERGGRRLPGAPREQDDPQVRVGPRIFGVQLQGPSVARLGGFEVPGLPLGETEVVLELGAVGNEGDEVVVARPERRRPGAGLEDDEQGERQGEERGPLDGVRGQEGVPQGDGRRRSGGPADAEGPPGVPPPGSSR